MKRWQDTRSIMLVACLITPALVGCSGDAADSVLDPTPRVLVVPVSVIDHEERIEASGELKAKDHAAIAAEIAGAITTIVADEGNKVQAGQVLLTIDPEKRRLDVANARARFQEAAASVGEAERDQSRIQKLHAQGIASDSNLDERNTAVSRARSRQLSAKAELGVAERALRDATLRAPFDGVVAMREVSRGEYVQPGMVLFTIVSLDPIELEFTVAERDSARIELGQNVRVEVAPYPDEEFAGTVTVIAPTMDARTRTLRVKARVDNADGRLRPGLFARADLGVAMRQGLLWVPQEAVLLRAQGQIVWVVDAENRVRRTLVETGVQQGDRIEIRRGLEAGQEVIVRGQTGLSEGVLVTRRTPEGTPAPAVDGAMNLAVDVDEMSGTL